DPRPREPADVRHRVALAHEAVAAVPDDAGERDDLLPEDVEVVDRPLPELLVVALRGAVPLTHEALELAHLGGLCFGGIRTPQDRRGCGHAGPASLLGVSRSRDAPT